MTLTKLLAGPALVATCFALGSTAYAQDAGKYPTERPVSLVVGFSAGGSTDMLARLLSKELSQSLGANFVVENKPGANSSIANSYVARANPDGHTLLMVPFGLPINQYLYQNVQYKYDEDFAPIALVAKVPNVIAVKADSPFKTVKDYVEHSKGKTSGLTFSTPGVGSSLHLAGELFKYDTGANILHVPYKGSAPSLLAVMAGDTDSAFENLSTAAPQITAGKLRALAVTSKTRSASFPDLPTVAESGFPEFEINSYFGLAAPAGTPPEIIEMLNKATMKALLQPEMQKYLNDLGAIVEENSPEEFAEFLESEAKRWGPVIKAAGIEQG